jgi:hypothetical protein
VVKSSPINESQAGQRRYHRVAVLTDEPDELPNLGLALRQFASDEVNEVVVWLVVERFRAPSSTHPPYRLLARQEARDITAQRSERAEAAAAVVVQAWDGYGWQIGLEAVLDASPESIAARLLDQEIDLLVSEGESGAGRMAAKASTTAGCPLLLVPSDASAASTLGTQRPRRNLFAPLIRTHG